MSLIKEQVLEDVAGISEERISEAISSALDGAMVGVRRLLILPPDYTRLYSGAGIITSLIWKLYSDKVHIDIMPALGTHQPMTEEEFSAFFGEEIPFERMIVHNWRRDVVRLGEVPSDFVREVSEGIVDEPIEVEVNRRIVDGGYDLILSVGQVVPHEVVGMANYSKNIFVGCGGSSMISSSHMLGAFYGMERLMGKDHSPVRRVFDYAEEKFLSEIPLCYILTVATSEEDKTVLHGLYIGRRRALFERAVENSQRMNFKHLDRPIKKAVVYLDGREFKSTWLGNKAIYRTRLAIENGGELIILAPSVRVFGEDEENDRLIRKYGYVGREKVLELVKTERELSENLSVAAHLIHGSTDGRFFVTYCTRDLSQSEVEGVGFGYMPYDVAEELYSPSLLKDGYNTVRGEEIYYISNPALGLWKAEACGEDEQ